MLKGLRKLFGRRARASPPGTPNGANKRRTNSVNSVNSSSSSSNSVALTNTQRAQALRYLNKVIKRGEKSIGLFNAQIKELEQLPTASVENKYLVNSAKSNNAKYRELHSATLKQRENVRAGKLTQYPYTFKFSGNNMTKVLLPKALNKNYGILRGGYIAREQKLPLTNAHRTAALRFLNRQINLGKESLKRQGMHVKSLMHMPSDTAQWRNTLVNSAKSDGRGIREIQSALLKQRKNVEAGRLPAQQYPFIIAKMGNKHRSKLSIGMNKTARQKINNMRGAWGARNSKLPVPTGFSTNASRSLGAVKAFAHGNYTPQNARLVRNTTRRAMAKMQAGSPLNKAEKRAKSMAFYSSTPAINSTRENRAVKAWNAGSFGNNNWNVLYKALRRANNKKAAGMSLTKTEKRVLQKKNQILGLYNQ